MNCRIGPQRRNAEQRFIRIIKSLELLYDNRLPGNSALYIRVGYDGRCRDVDEVRIRCPCHGCRTQFGSVSETGARSPGSLYDRDILQIGYAGIFGNGEDCSSPGDGERVSRFQELGYCLCRRRSEPIDKCLRAVIIGHDKTVAQSEMTFEFLCDGKGTEAGRFDRDVDNAATAGICEIAVYSSSRNSHDFGDFALRASVLVI